MRIKLRFVAFFLFVNSISATAQDTLAKIKSSNYYDMSLEDLMNIKVSVV